MGPELADAMGRLQAALGGLEAAIGRYMDTDARQSDLELELGVMQDDRSRLATELDSTAARLAQVEAVSAHVAQRVGTALGAVRELLGRAEAANPDPAGRG